jgi:hypothetical protein
MLGQHGPDFLFKKFQIRRCKFGGGDWQRGQ